MGKEDITLQGVVEGIQTSSISFPFLVFAYPNIRKETASPPSPSITIRPLHSPSLSVGLPQSKQGRARSRPDPLLGRWRKGEGLGWRWRAVGHFIVYYGCLAAFGSIRER
ncbi:hypothetical protein SLEP1_g48452 [Rubroshorea leprosula]|uniref:Uncharacterized protein n=1 Tax=Rubroshorea leprosula TaxID=152421 RepID=A0AAV5LTN3_9ROSI|nr:hypothetical protein SLEP1_g48452 [Rubroshorea leprosula]